MKKELGITLIALVITIIVILILAGVTIATLTGDNGLLQKATTAKQSNEEAVALEKIKVEVAGSYGLDGKIDVDNQLNQNLKRINGLTYNDNEIDLNDDTKKIKTLPATVKLDGYLYEIEENGKVSSKTGIILSSSNLSMTPGDTETLTVTFVGMQEENITWTSDTTEVVTVNQQGKVTATGKGEAKVIAMCGTKSATCNVTVVSKLANTVNIGDYVDINIGYMDQMDNTTDYTGTNKKIAWRVLSSDTTTGIVNLISTGHPLRFYRNEASSEECVTEMNKLSTQEIVVYSSTPGFYDGNGFSQDNIKDLFNNTSIFLEIQPARYSVNGKSINKNVPESVRKTGQNYWLGEAYNGSCLWGVSSSGSVWDLIGYSFGVRPVVTLVSGITIKDGAGTQDSPYRINGITYLQN